MRMKQAGCLLDRGSTMSTNPRSLGKYELHERLGRGGMAEVWKAFDPRLKRYVAIKYLQANLRDDPSFATRFIREAQAVASLRHPNIIRIYDFETSIAESDDSMAYMVIERLTHPLLFVSEAP
jgi:eukaryotic-like serine/threonine-protein kinase